MSKGSDLNHRRDCVKAYQLALHGYNNQQIAEALGCNVDQVLGKIKRGRDAVKLTGKKHVQGST